MKLKDIQDEIREIPGYNGKYLLTNTGKVFSYGRKFEDSSNIEDLELRELKIFGRGKTKIKTVDLYDGLGGSRKVSVHKLLAEVYLQHLQTPEKPFLKFKDGDKTNCFAGTAENNYEDGNLYFCSRFDLRIEKYEQYIEKYNKVCGV